MIKVLGILGSIVTIGTPFVLFFNDKTTFNEYVFSIYLCLLLAIIILRLIYVESAKKHRYADAVSNIHSVNHQIRDTLEKQKRSPVSENGLDSVAQLILAEIAASYSVVTGKKCRACIQGIEPDMQLINIARNGSNQTRTHKRTQSIEKNTMFKSLWYQHEGAKKYLICNDLVGLWKSGEYDNTSFEYYGEPKIVHYPLNYTRVSNWKLPYKSAIVLPIRCLVGDADSPEESYWGYLCIDCNSKNVFDNVHCPELGAAFADALYTLFSQSAEKTV